MKSQKFFINLKGLLLLSGIGLTNMLNAQNVGIGTTTPTAPLLVIANDTARGIVQKKDEVEMGFYTAGGVAFLQTWSPTSLFFATGNGSQKISLIHGSGFVGINTGVPTAQMDVNGTFRLRGNGAGAGKVLTSDGSGNATWQTPASVTSSDVYSVGSSDFKAEHSSNSITVSGGNGGAYFDNAYYGNMVAPIHLPNGAKITGVTVWYIDTNPNEDISFTLYGEYNNQGFYTSVASGTSTGSAGGYRSVNLTVNGSNTIDNNAYAYQVNAFTHWPGNSSTFVVKGVKIQYTY